MQPRDIFDGILVALLAVILYLEVIGLSISTESLVTVVDAVRNIDTMMLLVAGGALGVIFLGYITIYVPQKMRTERPEQKSQ